MLAWQIQWFKALHSTQDYLRKHYACLPSGTCIVSETQLGGYGRKQRVWYSAAGGLYFSFLLKPAQILPFLPWALLWASLDALELVSECSLSIKAPNDLLYQGQKLAGMLIDSRLSGTVPEYYICGLGINLNQTFFPAELDHSAVSLFQMTGKTWSFEFILEVLLEQFNTKYTLLQGTDFESEILKTLGNRELRISYNGANEVFKEYWHGQ